MDSGTVKVRIVDLAAQHKALKTELMEALEHVIDTTAFVGLGANVEPLEAEIAAICGTSRAVGCNSGTDALLLSLLALGIGPGDEVITAPFTFVATVETICLAGATPVLADIDATTFNLDPAKAAEKINPRTKAIMPVHLFGQAADMTAIGKLAKEHDLRTIGDGAQAIGATQNGKSIGAIADMTTLSFYPTKNLGACGDAGMIVTDDEAAAKQAWLLRSHGAGAAGGYYYNDIGYCSRLDGIQAALLRVKVKRLAAWNEARRKNAAHYAELLSGLGDHVSLPQTLPGNVHVYHQYTVRVLNGKRDELEKHLNSRGIEARVFYPLALNLQPGYARYNFDKDGYPEAVRATQEVLSLPVHADLTESEIAYVAETIQAFFGS